MMSALNMVLVGLAGVAGGAGERPGRRRHLDNLSAAHRRGYPAGGRQRHQYGGALSGFLGGTFAQFKDLRGQERRLWLLLPASLVGASPVRSCS